MAELLAEPRRVRCGLSASCPGRRRGRRRNASRRSLPRRSYRLEVDAGVAAQLMDYPLADDSERLAGEFRIECGDGGGGLATERLELGLSGSPDARKSSSGINRSPSLCASSLVRSQTPPSCGVPLAISLASFARVFVGLMPNSGGNYVHIARAFAVISANGCLSTFSRRRRFGDSRVASLSAVALPWIPVSAKKKRGKGDRHR